MHRAAARSPTRSNLAPAHFCGVPAHASIYVSPRLRRDLARPNPLFPGKSAAGCRNTATSPPQLARHTPHALGKDPIASAPETPASAASSVTMMSLQSDTGVQTPATPQPRTVPDLDMCPLTESLTTPTQDGRFTYSIGSLRRRASMPSISQKSFGTPPPKNTHSSHRRGPPPFSPGSPRLTKPTNLEGRVDAMNSAVENLVRMTRRSLVQSKSRAKVRPEMRSDLSDWSDGAGSSTLSTRSPSSIGLASSNSVTILDAAALQRNFDAINVRMDNILQDQEHIKQGQSEIMALLRTQSANA